MVRRRRVIFACKECDEALVWPTEQWELNDPSSGCLYTVADGFHRPGSDALGRATVQLHPDRMWRLTVDPSGRARCTKGHPVGEATTGQNPPPWYIALWTEKVVSRDMRGRL